MGPSRIKDRFSNLKKIIFVFALFSLLFFPFSIGNIELLQNPDPYLDPVRTYEKNCFFLCSFAFFKIFLI